VLLPVLIGTVWLLPPIFTFALAVLVAVLAFLEYRTIAAALGVSVAGGIGAVAVALACYAVWAGDRTVDSHSWSLPIGGIGFTDTVAYQPNVIPLVFMAAFVVTAALSVARGRPAAGVLNDAAATMLAPVYIGMPLGALAWIREPRFLDVSLHRPDPRIALLLLAVVIIVSDSAQYYTGRTFGRRPLAPTISPKKTVEGAVGGVVFGTLAATIGGRYVFASPIWVLALLIIGTAIIAKVPRGKAAAVVIG